MTVDAWPQTCKARLAASPRLLSRGPGRAAYLEDQGRELAQDLGPCLQQVECLQIGERLLGGDATVPAQQPQSQQWRFCVCMW